ncbi:MAG: GAF domain-containing protein [Syntrophomonadaceae bacterium]|nr:GAF domain-containing protein [Syntrophomonadaceae bacterium]
MEKYREITAYFNITEQLAANLEFGDIAQFLIEEAQRLIKVGDVSIVMQEDSNREILASSRQESSARDILQVYRSVIDSVMASVKPEVINDFAADHRCVQGDIGAGSVMCAPLAIKNKVLGVMIVSSEKPADYTAGELKLLSSVAYITAAALENARLFARLKDTVEDLKIKTEELTKSIKTRAVFGMIYISVVMMVCLYTLSIILLDNFQLGYKERYIVSRSVEMAYLIMNLILVYRSGMPLSEFGLTLKNAKKSVVESLAVSVVLLLGLVMLKMHLINTVPAFYGDSIFSWDKVNIDFYTYILSAPLQEFLCRGILQGSVQRFLLGPLNWLWAIILTSSLFGVFHIHESTALGLLAIVGGIIWGGMYVRHKNIIGASINHFLLGNGLVVLDLWDVIVYGIY